MTNPDKLLSREEDALKQEQAIVESIEKLLQKKRDLRRDMGSTEEQYRGQKWDPKSGVHQFGPGYERMQEELVKVDDALNDLARELQGVVRGDSKAAKKYLHLLKK